MLNIYIKRSLVILLVILMLAPLYYLKYSLDLTYVSSNSINPTFLITDNGKLELGKYITFNVAPYLRKVKGADQNKVDKLLEGKDNYLLASKRLACLAGSSLTSREIAAEKRWYCDNKYIANQIILKKMFTPPEQVKKTTTHIPANTAFVLGDNLKDSVDSRYFGLIDLTKDYRLQQPINHLFN